MHVNSIVMQCSHDIVKKNQDQTKIFSFFIDL